MQTFKKKDNGQNEIKTKIYNKTNGKKASKAKLV